MLRQSAPKSKKVCAVFQKSNQPFHLQMDNSMPMLIQLQGKGGSETHDVTVFQNNIYDSASRYVLMKLKETLEWCCGMYGYIWALRT
jgi:hypothetical protein